MFAWSRLEVGLAVLLATLILVGGTVQWWTAGKAGVRTVIVEAKEAMEDRAAGAAGVPRVADDIRHAEAEGGEVANIGSADTEGTNIRAGGGDTTGGETAGDPVGETMDTERAEAVVDERININTAHPSELERLPGIGPALARRIVEYRELWGPFDTIEDIMEVSGIGPVKFANMKHMIKVR